MLWDFFFLSIMYLALTIQPKPVMFTFFVKFWSALHKMPKKRIAINKFISALWGGSKMFPALSKMWILLGGYNHSLSVDAKIMVSRNYPIIGKHVAVNFVAQLVTIATIWPAKNTLNFSFKYLQLKMSSVTPNFYYRIMISMTRCNCLQLLK